MLVRAMRPGASVEPDKAARVLVLRLRRKLKAAGLPPIIRTLHGYGFVAEGVVVLDPGGQFVLGPEDRKIVRLLIDACPSPTLAELARQRLLG